ncbi:uncharacterized protein BO96DRAFT_126329 [Aspergillus niger CBS 101883]|uniref:Uncharacterized protein n=1 Tax=Aspergillus niger ATCC 13496 TaxID=1353008 RepID=A0A370C7I2_ASPNG|nr:uncharacterized protein BO96DRAFT_126329 [Aspergillus niger CBS 101883]PYH53367.1 hypothetical protein BO96DRAFT_126329 [Aspergillus niger CBS 101883]RDH23778.1 hypothetical protein M747DRAFT_132406 [Aspergillus niger ATCC 13496]
MAGNLLYSCFSCIRVLGTAYGMVPFLLTFVLIVAGLFCSMNVITCVPFSSGVIHFNMLWCFTCTYIHISERSTFVAWIFLTMRGGLYLWIFVQLLPFLSR